VELVVGANALGVDCPKGYIAEVEDENIPGFVADVVGSGAEAY
jgi:hypothetical protein